MTLNYIKSEFRKLISMTLLIIVITLLIGINFIGTIIFIGFMLMLEHLIVYGRFDFFDFLGHEWFGLILVIVPLLIISKWVFCLLVIAAFLIACRFKWTQKLSPIKYALNKLRFK